MNEIVEKAKWWAHTAHDSIGQKRKYGGDVYWVHTDTVAELLRQSGESEDVQAAGHLHDILEDVSPTKPEFSKEKMLEEFGSVITKLVEEVTDVFIKENYPSFNRAKRKHLEHERIAKISKDAKSIKLADIIHNVDGLVGHNPDFAKVFLAEKVLALPLLTEGNSILYKKACRVVADEIAKLKEWRERK